MLEGRINQVDMPVSKTIHIGDKMTLQGIVDLANIFNGSAIEVENVTYGTKWRTPTQILDPRLAKFGAKFNF